jgi:seryl-tRNA synthetase
MGYFKDIDKIVTTRQAPPLVKKQTPRRRENIASEEIITASMEEGMQWAMMLEELQAKVIRQSKGLASECQQISQDTTSEPLQKTLNQLSKLCAKLVKTSSELLKP